MMVKFSVCVRRILPEPDVNRTSRTQLSAHLPGCLGGEFPRAEGGGLVEVHRGGSTDISPMVQRDPKGHL